MPVSRVCEKKEKPPHFNNELYSLRRPSTLYLYWMYFPVFLRKNDPPFFSLCCLTFASIVCLRKKEKPPHFNNELYSLRRPSTLYLYWMYFPVFSRKNDPPFFSLCYLIYACIACLRKKKKNRLISITNYIP